MQKIIIALLLYFFSVVSFATTTTPNNYDQSVTKIINDLMQQYQIPGAAVAIVDHNKTYTYVFGVANKADNTPVSSKTIFEVGSITKLFTALTFVATDDSYKHLNDSLIKYLPELSKNTSLRKITMGKLLTYTTGLPFQLPEGITTIAQVDNYLLNWQPTSTTKDQWQYSNIDIGLVGIALQNTRHGTLDQLYKKYIFDQLNMPYTGIELTDKLQPYLAQGYAENGTIAAQSKDWLFPAAGALKTNIEDISHFLAVAVERPTIDLRLRQAMRHTQTPQLAIGNTLQGLVWQIHSLQDNELLNEPSIMNFGPIPAKPLPKKLRTFDANKLIDKTGATTGFRSYIAVIPKQQLGIVILLNKYIDNGTIVNAGRKILLEKQSQIGLSYEHSNAKSEPNA